MARRSDLRMRKKSRNIFSDNSELVEENQQDAYWTNVTHAEHVEREDVRTQGAAIRQLGLNQLAVQIPSGEEADDNATYRQDNL